MSEISLSEKEAYQAMFSFLEHLYEITKDDSLGGFLGSMQLLPDGKPIDSAYWEDWVNIINKIVKARGNG